MKCENPMYAVNIGGKFRFVGAVHGSSLAKRKYLYSTENKVISPCHQCYACRLNDAREWATRCVLEAMMYSSNCFITLTYDDVHLPADMSVHKEVFQKFMKRLRKNTGADIRYYACGEYGELYQRPHYHACLFGYSPLDKFLYKYRNGIPLYISDTIAKAWQYQGYVTVGDVTYESAAYVARYIDKKLTGEVADEFYGDREPPFHLMSRRPGLASPYFERYGEDAYAKDFIVIRDSLKVKPPRYFDSIYDKYYGDGAFEDLIKSGRIERAEVALQQNKSEATLERITAKARWTLVKHRNDRRDYVEL